MDGESAVAQQPVCITGMHRSGTSMVARILSSCGLWLGPDNRLMPPKPDNIDGFFENLDLVALNTQLIERHGGGWDAPPFLPQGWEHSPLSDEFTAAAQRWAADVFSGAPTVSSWGWKDPRCCFTLPFWKRLYPQIKTVVCLRNPMAVAQSLRKRGNCSIQFGVRLWLVYNSQLLKALEPGSYIITHYDAWLTDPDAELTRILVHLRWDVPPDLRAEALVKRSYRHHQGEPLSAVLGVGGFRVAKLYDELRTQAGACYRMSEEGRVAVRSDWPVDAQVDIGSENPEGLQAQLYQELESQRQANARLAAALGSYTSRVFWYRPGDVIDFRRGGNAPLYASQGWGEASPAGTWSVGVLAELRLRMTEDYRGEFKLLVRFRPLVGNGQTEVRVQVNANGHAQAEWEASEARIRDVEALIKLPICTEGECVTIQFVVVDPKSPHELGLSGDKRKLGIFVQEIRTAPMM